MSSMVDYGRTTHKFLAILVSGKIDRAIRASAHQRFDSVLVDFVVCQAILFFVGEFRYGVERFLSPSVIEKGGTATGRHERAWPRDLCAWDCSP